MKLGTRFLRVAAAGVPQAALGFEPHHAEPRAACCRECGCDHPVLVDEYYFWLVDTQYYTYTDQTDAQSNPDVSFAGSYQFGFQDSLLRIRSSNNRRNGTKKTRCRRCSRNGSRIRRCAWRGVVSTTDNSGSPASRTIYVAISQAGRSRVPGPRRGLALLPGERRPTVPPPAIPRDPSPAGFRYDLASDEAVGYSSGHQAAGAPHSISFPGRIALLSVLRLPRRGRASVPRLVVRPLDGGGRGAAGALPFRTCAQMVSTRFRPATAGLHLDELPRHVRRSVALRKIRSPLRLTRFGSNTAIPRRSRIWIGSKPRRN